MTIADIGGLAMIALTALLILKQYKPEWTPFVRIAVTLLAMGSLLTMIGGILTNLQTLTNGTDALHTEAWTILLKALGVAFLTETAASVCRDSGESGLAGWVETAGKMEILLLAFPLIQTAMETVKTLLGGP